MEGLIPPKDLTVAYLGPAGTHSHLAAIAVFGPTDRHGFRYQSCEGERELKEVVAAVAEGQAGWGVTPFFNDASGPIRATSPSVVDFEQGDYPKIRVVACIAMQITHDLLGQGPVEGIEHVYSKQEPLVQCSETLKRILPHAELHGAKSTAEAVQLAEKAGPKAAAVASRQVLPFHPRMKMLRPSVQDSPVNITRFMVIRHREGRYCARPSDLPRHTWIVFTSSPEKPTLPKIVSVAERWGIGVSAMSGAVVNPHTYEMRFMLELHWPIDSMKVSAFLSETSYLHRPVVGSPFVGSTEWAEAIQSWTEQQVASLEIAAEAEKNAASEVLPLAFRESIAKLPRYSLYVHPPVSSMESVWQVLGVPADRMINTQICREKTSGKIVFCSVRGDARVDVAKVSSVLGGKYRRIRREDVSNLGQHLGAVSPFTATPGARVMIDRTLTAGGDLFAGSGDPRVSLVLHLTPGNWPPNAIHADIRKG